MIQIYQSDYLTIKNCNGVLIQEWKDQPLTVDRFKKEMQTFLKYFKKIKPGAVLWLQEHFNLTIPSDLFNWLEKSILEPQYRSGLRKMAITIPRNQSAHMSVIDSFNKVSSVMHPQYFVDKEKALNYLLEGTSYREFKEVNYEISRTLDKTQILLEVHHRHLPHAIRHLDRLKEQFHFRMKHANCFEQLTIRELEILKAICTGEVNREIADRLFLSESTVATHRKSIVKKLNIKCSNDWHQFASAFL